MAAPLVDGFMLWRCKCGKTSYRHHEHCDSCGEERPAPPPEAEPSDVSRPDSGPVTGGMNMGLDLSIRPVDGTLHVGDTVTVGDGRWVIVSQYTGQPSARTSFDLQEAQMQRADEPLPTTEPDKPGILWNNNGVLTCLGLPETDEDGEPLWPELDSDEDEDEEC